MQEDTSKYDRLLAEFRFKLFEDAEEIGIFDSDSPIAPCKEHLVDLITLAFAGFLELADNFQDPPLN